MFRLNLELWFIQQIAYNKLNAVDNNDFFALMFGRSGYHALSMVRKSCDGSRKLVGVRVLRRQRSDAAACCGTGGYVVGVACLSR